MLFSRTRAKLGGRNSSSDDDPGDWTADRLYETYSSPVYRFCLRLCGGNTANAEDLAQDVLVLGWQSRNTFERGAARTYLFRIAVNRWGRLRSQVQAAERREQEAQALSDVADGLSDQTALKLDIERALTLLPEDLRLAFVVVKSEGLTYREAGRVLEVPQGTLQSRVHEATQRLRRLLSEEATAVRPAASAERSPTASDSAASTADPAARATVHLPRKGNVHVL